MSRPLGFTMQLATMTRPRACDVCTTQEADAWVETLVSGIPQSDVCIDCARDAGKLARAVRTPVAA